MHHCPDAEILSRLLEEQLDPTARAEVEAHVERCGECQSTLDRLTREEGEPTARVSQLLLAQPAADDVSAAVAQRLTWTWAASTNGLAIDSVTVPPDRWLHVEGYEILGELGRGGMAVVYKARHLALDRLVALKMVNSGPQLAGEVRERFRQEARALAILRHPNIVQVYDVGEQDGWPYFSLELVAGMTLAGWLSGVPRAPREAAELVESLARAVDYAHQNGVIHRDLKPANILLQRSGVRNPQAGGDGQTSSDLSPKITDFGLAKAIGEAGSPAEPLTEAGAVLGTPSYMAPEQACEGGHLVGPAADVYALGAILYEILTGRPPFLASTPLQTLLQVVHDDPVPVTQLQPRTPRDLATICGKCLEKEPGKRYLRAADLADDLRRLLNHEPILARPIGPTGRLIRWTRRRPTQAGLVAALVGVAVVGFALVVWQWQETTVARGRAESLASSEAAAHATARAERDDATSARRRAERTAALLLLDQSLDLCERGDVRAGMLGLARGLEQSSQAELDDLGPVFRTNLACWSRRLLVPAESPPLGASATAVAYTPDGKRLLVGRWANPFNKPGPGEAQLWNPDGWKPIGPAFRPPGPVTAVAVSPDGTRVLTAGPVGPVHLWDAATGKLAGEHAADFRYVGAVAFSPNGKTYAVGGMAGGDPTGQVWVLDTATGKPALEPLEHPGEVHAVAYSPDGQVLLTGCTVSEGRAVGGQARLWDAATGRPIGPVLMHSGAVLTVGFSHDGKLVLTGCADQTTRVWDRATGRQLGQPQLHPYPVLAAAFIPDRKTIVAGGGVMRRGGSGEGIAGLWDIATGKPLVGPLAHPDVVHGVAVRPDGQAVATAGRDGRVRVWELTNLRPAVEIPHPFPLSAVAFTPDGKWVVSAGSDPDRRRTQVWDATASRPAGAAVAHEQSIEALAVSPDGRTYATGYPDGTARVWDRVTGRPVGGPQKHHGVIDSLSYHPDGRVLLVTAKSGPVRFWTVSTGERIWETAAVAGQVHAATFSPDGLAVATGGADGMVRVWDAASGREVLAIAAGRKGIHAVGFSPDGRAILAGGAGGSARLWAAATGHPLGPPLDHGEDVVWAVGFTAGSTRVYTVAGNPYRTWGTVRLWDAVTGEQLHPALPFRVSVRATTYHPETRLLVTGGWEGDVRLWDVETGRPVGPRLGCVGAVAAASLSPDGGSVVAGGEDGVLRVWHLPRPIEGTPDQVSRRVATLTAGPGEGGKR